MENMESKEDNPGENYPGWIIDRYSDSFIIRLARAERPSPPVPPATGGSMKYRASIENNPNRLYREGRAGGGRGGVNAIIR